VLFACQAYIQALNKTGIAGVRRLELAIRQKIEQRTAGGGMVLRKAFKYFDADASGDIDPDEFYSAMHAFGLEFTEDQVTNQPAHCTALHGAMGKAAAMPLHSVRSKLLCQFCSFRLD
jgi:hypothetical protein